MQLYIMRHGQANPVGPIDENRPLNEAGEREVVAMANWAISNNVEFEHVIVSPFVRAQQTCEIFLRELSQSSCPKTSVNIITPFGDAKQVHDYIDGFIAQHHLKSLLIISHMPLVSFLTAELTYDQSAPIFQTAAILNIDYDMGKMKGTMMSLSSPHDI